MLVEALVGDGFVGGPQVGEGRHAAHAPARSAGGDGDDVQGREEVKGLEQLNLGGKIVAEEVQLRELVDEAGVWAKLVGDDGLLVTETDQHPRVAEDDILIGELLEALVTENAIDEGWCRAWRGILDVEFVGWRGRGSLLEAMDGLFELLDEIEDATGVKVRFDAMDGDVVMRGVGDCKGVVVGLG